MTMRELRTPLLSVLFAASVATAVIGQVWLQATFATVRHPVTLAVANTTADPGTVRGWYRVLIEQGTLDRMVTTELVDYVWVLGLAASVVLLTVLVARLLRRRNPRASRLLSRLAPWAALAPGIDAIENALSLLMLADPLGFPDILAFAHAGVSWLKLAAIIAVSVALGVYALWAAWTGGDGSDRGSPVPPRIAAPDAH